MPPQTVPPNSRSSCSWLGSTAASLTFRCQTRHSFYDRQVSSSTASVSSVSSRKRLSLTPSWASAHISISSPTSSMKWRAQSQTVLLASFNASSPFRSTRSCGSAFATKAQATISCSLDALHPSSIVCGAALCLSLAVTSRITLSGCCSGYVSRKLR